MELYYLGNYRTKEQLAEMQRLEAAGICLFCPEHLCRDNNHIPVYRSAHWTATHNRYPYQGSRSHLILIPDEHVTDLVELSAPAKQDFWAVLGWVRDHHEMTHYGVGVRNGDPRFTGGTIRHLHVHVVVGDVDNPHHEPVRMKLSSRPKTDQP